MRVAGKTSWATGTTRPLSARHSTFFAGYHLVADPLEGWTPTLLQHGVLPVGHKLANLFTRGLGARNLLLVKIS